MVDQMGNTYEMLLDEDAYVDKMFAGESEELRNALKEKFREYEEARRNYKHYKSDSHYDIDQIIRDWIRSGKAY